MRDEDSSSVTVAKNERRLNTLSHYRVPDGCTLALVARYSAAARSNGEHINYFKYQWRIQAVRLDSEEALGACDQPSP